MTHGVGVAVGGMFVDGGLVAAVGSGPSVHESETWRKESSGATLTGGLKATSHRLDITTSSANI